MDVTGTLVKFLFETKFEDLPPEVVGKAKLIILDALGCGIGGTTTDLAKVAWAVTKEVGGGGECTVIGTQDKTNCVQAAWANSIIVNALDMDDTGPVGHPGATIIPAALAVAERYRSSGKELLNAVILGYEATSRVGMGMFPTWERFYEVRGMPYLIFGGTVAAVKLLRLTYDQLLNAVGIGGATAAIPVFAQGEPRPLSWIKDNVSWPAAGSVNAALMAQKGFVANQKILDRFWIKAASDRWIPEKVTQGLGKDFKIMGTSFKHFPCCFDLHNALRALSEIIEANDLKAEQVESVVARGPWFLPKNFVEYKPTALVDAQFSLPYVVAMALLRKPATQWYSPENMRNPGVLKLGERVSAVMDPEIQERYLQGMKATGTQFHTPTQVEVKTKDGRILTAVADRPRGDPSFMSGREDISGKFRQLSKGIIGERKGEELVATIDRLDSIADVTQITEILRW
jgi:2-methylcitrate dehydratase PrpD